jgi:hypothetical protein
MARKCEIENLVKVKTTLANKYIRLARARKSKPWQARLYRRAETYRRQAEILARGISMQPFRGWGVSAPLPHAR